MQKLIKKTKTNKRNNNINFLNQTKQKSKGSFHQTLTK